VSIFKFLNHLLSKTSSEFGPTEKYDLASHPSSSSWGGLHEAKVARVLDGDTVDVLMADGEEIRVRLECIDCPEGDQPWGDIAKAGLIKQIGGARHVYLEVHGLDVHDRVLATIYVMVDTELINVNERMVMLGHAWSTTHIHKQLSLGRRRQLEALEEWAKTKKVGLWGTESPIAPWEWRADGKKKHTEAASALQTSSAEIDVVSDYHIEKYVARKNRFTNKYFIEFEDEVLISPEGKDIELDLERFGDPEDVTAAALTEKQLLVYQNKINARDFNATEAAKSSELQKKLFNELRKARTRISMTRGVPAYVVFEDKTLIEMAEVMPDSELIMLQIWGVGPDKFRMYGAYFIAVVKNFKRDNVIGQNRKKDTA
jgi:micrococcal nuclease